MNEGNMRELDFPALERAGGVRLIPDVREQLAMALKVWHILLDRKKQTVPSRKAVVRQLSSGIAAGEKFNKSIDSLLHLAGCWLQVRFETEKGEPVKKAIEIASAAKERLERIKHEISDIMEVMSHILQGWKLGERYKPGKEKDVAWGAFISLVDGIFRRAGGTGPTKSNPYDVESDSCHLRYDGPSVDLFEELFRQIGQSGRYKSRNSLGAAILRFRQEYR